MERPLFVCAGEKFERILIFKDKVVCDGKRGTVEMPMKFVPCLNGRPCPYYRCRHYVENLELNNCTLNTDREFDLDEIAKAVGYRSRQAVDQLINGSHMPGRDQWGVLGRARKALKRLTKERELRNLLPDSPPPLHKSKHREVSDYED